jgi:hypothetical protein
MAESKVLRNIVIHRSAKTGSKVSYAEFWWECVRALARPGASKIGMRAMTADADLAAESEIKDLVAPLA